MDHQQQQRNNNNPSYMINLSPTFVSALAKFFAFSVISLNHFAIASYLIVSISVQGAGGPEKINATMIETNTWMYGPTDSQTYSMLFFAIASVASCLVTAVELYGDHLELRVTQYLTMINLTAAFLLTLFPDILLDPITFIFSSKFYALIFLLLVIGEIRDLYYAPGPNRLATSKRSCIMSVLLLATMVDTATDDLTLLNSYIRGITLDKNIDDWLKHTQAGQGARFFPLILTTIGPFYATVHHKSTLSELFKNLFFLTSFYGHLDKSVKSPISCFCSIIFALILLKLISIEDRTVPFEEQTQQQVAQEVDHAHQD